MHLDSIRMLLGVLRHLWPASPDLESGISSSEGTELRQLSLQDSPSQRQFVGLRVPDSKTGQLERDLRSFGSSFLVPGEIEAAQ